MKDAHSNSDAAKENFLLLGQCLESKLFRLCIARDEVGVFERNIRDTILFLQKILQSPRVFHSGNVNQVISPRQFTTAMFRGMSNKIKTS